MSYNLSEELQSKIKQLNDEIVEAHDKHYDSCPTGLWKPNDSPNGNRMYHLYIDGEITNQKGGWAYGERNVFTDEYPVPNMVRLGFDFPKKHDRVKESYVILTEKECYEYRNKMIELLQKILK